MPLPSDLATLRAWLCLSAAPGVGAVAIRRLMDELGSTDVPLHDALSIRLPAPPDASTEALVADTLAWLDAPAHHLLTLADERYPAPLRAMADPPSVLYVVGDPACLATPAIAMVGARHATPGGLALAEDFAQELAAQGWTIVSGLALGIDGAAHRGAIAATSGCTVAVVGTGVDVIYPARHRALAERIVARGALVSELPLGTPPAAHHFPRRNRIVAGLSRGVLVVEAAVHSGSLITARLAADMGREVFAIPGSIHSPLSRGCHALIRQGAKLVETARDVVEELAPHAPPPPARPVAVAVPAPADPVLDALGFDPLDFDALHARSGMAAEDLLARLLTLELDGRIARLPGSRFQRLA